MLKTLRNIPEPDETHRRLPNIPFPTYRFVPGLHKHPNLSKEHNMPEVALTECWAYGWDLYEHHYWWEAHEVWERLWKALPLNLAESWPKEHPTRRYVQGHILLSASRLLAHMGRPSERMWAKGQQYISDTIHPFE